MTSFDLFARMCKPCLTTNEGTVYKLIKSSLLDPGPDIVILDEAHLMLKNSKSDISKALISMNTSRRILLSGTPIQNNLLDYFRMANWIKPNCLGNETQFKKKYLSDIMNSMTVSFPLIYVRLSTISMQ